MKKLTYFFLTLFMLIGGGNLAWAIDPVTFDFTSNDGYAAMNLNDGVRPTSSTSLSKGTTIELNDITLSFSGTGNAPALTKDGWLRVYKNTAFVLTVTSGYNINSVEVQFNVYRTFTVTDGTLTENSSGKKFTWKGNSNSITFSNSTTGAADIEKIIVSYQESGTEPGEPNPGEQDPTEDPQNQLKNLTCKIVEDVTTLKDGDVISLAAFNEKFYVMGEDQTNNRKAILVENVTSLPTSFDFPADASAISLIDAGTEDEIQYWRLYDGTGYLLPATTGTKNYLNLVSEIAETNENFTKAEISSGSVEFKVGADSRKIIALNLNKTGSVANPIFSCYKSSSLNNSYSKVTTYKLYSSKTISTFQYASYVPSMNVIVPENVNAFYLKKEDVSGETATLTKVEAGTVVEAGTALVVYTSKTDGETVYFPANANEITTLTDNVLKVASATNQPVANQDYVFGQIDGNVGFYQFEEGFTVADGTVFVEGDSSNGLNAKGFRITFDNETTGISNATVKNEASSVIYNLAGQKVDAGYKGIVIKNGKKYINK